MDDLSQGELANNSSAIDSQSTSQKRRASLSLRPLKLDSIPPIVRNGQTTHPKPVTPSTAMVLKVFQNTAPEVEEIVKEIQCNVSKPIENPPELNIESPAVFSVFTPTFNNPFEKAFENASAHPPRLPVSPMAEHNNKETESLNTPSISLSTVSPLKLLKDNNFHPPSSLSQANAHSVTLECNANANNQSQDQNNAQVKRPRRGRPPKQQPTNESNEGESKKNLKERNRLAALKHREGRKKWANELSARVRVLEDRNAILEVKFTVVYADSNKQTISGTSIDASEAHWSVGGTN